MGRFGRRAAGSIAAVAGLCLATALVACAAVQPASPKPPPGSADLPQANRPALDMEQVAAGQRIAEEHCSACHAIDAKSPSPRADAPPLRNVLALDPEGMLAEHLIEGTRIGHDEMPRFDFNIRAADALVAYLKSIYAGPPPE